MNIFGNIKQYVEQKNDTTRKEKIKRMKNESWV